MRYANSPKKEEWFTCPNCGAEVSVRAKACPECGSDDQTGWSDNTLYDNTGIPDYEDIDNEFEPRETGIPIFFKIAAVLLILIFATMLLGNLSTQ